MATKKRYAYYLKGNKIGLTQQETNTTSTDLRSEDYGKYKSPIDAVTDGLEIVYSYSPNYRIESTNVTTTTLSGWDQDNNGNLRFRASGSTDWTSSPNLSSVTYIVLKNAGRWNGLHKISSVTNNRIVTTTKVSASTNETLFEETVTMYYDVSAMEDESYELDLPRYQANAVVYYLKARLAEDMGELQMKEYFMREFKRSIEKFDSSQKTGIHQIQGNQLMNRKNIG